MIPIGALHFADPKGFYEHNADHSALLARNGSVTRLPEGVADVPTGMWWSNVDYSVLQRANLIGHPSIYHAGYLPTRPLSVVAEIGLADADPEAKADACGQVFSRVIHQANAVFGVPIPAIGSTLADAMRDHFFGDRLAAEIDGAVQYAIDDAGQSVTQSGVTDVYDDAKLMVLRHHRQSYAAAMLGQPVPFGAWQAIDVPVIDAQPDWVREQEMLRPLLLRVTLRFSGAQRHERTLLAGFGSGRDKGSSPRQWIATPEYLALLPFASIEIHDAFAADGFQPNPWCMLDPIGKGSSEYQCVRMGPVTIEGVGVLSYSEGLLAEAFWTAASRSRGPHKSPTGMWMLATDRAHCLTQAFGIQAMGLLGVQITGFARGRIWVRLNTGELATPEDQALALAEIASLTGLVPPVLPEVRDWTVARRSIALNMHARSQQSEDPTEQAGWMVSALHVLGNRALLAELA